MTKRVLIYTDSRGQHTPAGQPAHKVFAERLAEQPGIDAKIVLCPMKWTTSLDFLDYLGDSGWQDFDHVIAQTGIVEWSPRPWQSAKNDLYRNLSEVNLDSLALNTRDYSRKVVNNKKSIFDRVFGADAMTAHFERPFDVEYEGQPTINMYDLAMAKASLLPRLKAIDNLIFINSNRFVPGWEGDFKRGRPANIGLTEAYSELFRDYLGDRVIDLLTWSREEIMKYTCDNLHLTKEGSDWIFEELKSRVSGRARNKSVQDLIDQGEEKKPMLIIGNGPSAKKIADIGFDKISQSVDTFGMGAAYRFFEQANWWPTYYACCDAKVVRSHHDAFSRLVESEQSVTERFYFAGEVSNAERVVRVPHSSTGDFCFRQARALGYETIFIIGVEGEYVEELPEARLLTDEEYESLGYRDLASQFVQSEGRSITEDEFRKNLRIIDENPVANPNYFFDAYQLQGDVYSVPRSGTHQRRWQEISAADEQHTLNLSDRSQLIQYPLVDFSSFIRASQGASFDRAALAVQRPSAISVIVPAYNVEDYIEECLQSLAEQTDPSFEVIVINDGSTDQTHSIAERYCAGRDNFRIIDQQNRGLGGARNTGIRAARGAFLTFLDSDDTLRPDALALMREAQQTNDADVVSARMELVTEAGERISSQKGIDWQFADPPGWADLSYADKVLGVFYPSVSCGRLYRRSHLLSGPFFFQERIPHEDFFFTYRVLLSAQRHVEITDEVYFWRQRTGSLSKAISRAHVDVLSELIHDTARNLSPAKATPTQRLLSFRRTLIFLGGLIRRVQVSSDDAASYLESQLVYLAPTLLDMIRTLRDSPAGLSGIERKVVEKVTEYAALRLPNKPRLPMPDFRAKDQAGPPVPAGLGIGQFKDRFKGKRCFIIGNGPSLNKHDLSKLKGEYSFGVNSFFYKTRETGFRPTFFVVEDNMVMKENIEEIRRYEVEYKFFPTDYRELHGDAQNVRYFNMDQGFYMKSSPFDGVARFSPDASQRMFCGQTVTYINMQLAFFMGFEEVHLIGMDFNYIVPKEHIQTGNHIKSTTDDPNHFHKDYFGKGKTWKDPKLERVALNYQEGKRAFEVAGRKIYNATVGGKLEIFDRVDYEDLLSGRSLHSASSPVERKAELVAPTSRVAPTLPTNKFESADESPAAESNSAGSAAVQEGPVDKTRTASSPNISLRRPFYASFGDWLRQRLPVAFGVAQVARRVFWGLARRWFVSLPLLAVFLLLLTASFRPQYSQYQMLILSSSVVALLAFAIGYLGYRTYRSLQVVIPELTRVAQRADALFEAQKSSEQRAAALARQQGVLRSHIDDVDSKQTVSLDRVRHDLTPLLALSRQVAQTSEIARQASAKASALDVQYSKQLVGVRAQVDQLKGQVSEALAAQDKVRLLESGLQEIRSELSDLSRIAEDAKAEGAAAVGQLKETFGQLSTLGADIQQARDALSTTKLALTCEIQDVAAVATQAHGEVTKAQAELAEVKNNVAGAADGLTALQGTVAETQDSFAQAEKNTAKSVRQANSRLASAERNLRTIVFPDAPRTLVFFGHHKCASRFFRLSVFRRLLDHTGGKLRKYSIEKPPFHYAELDELDLCNMNFDGLGEDQVDLVEFANASVRSLKKIQTSTDDWRGLRVIRDPRQVLVSNYFHHRGDHPIAGDPDKGFGFHWDDLARDKPILWELPEEEGLLHELDNISKQVIEKQLLAPFEDARVLTIKLEEYAREPAIFIEAIAAHFQVPGLAGVDFTPLGKNPGADDWEKHFTSRLRARFKELYGDDLIRLGYATNMDW